MTETPAAKQAFEDLWALGDARSISALAAEYRRRSDGGKDVPTTRERTLEEWSSKHGWQARLKQRIAEESERVREEDRKDADKVRRTAKIITQTEIRRVAAALADGSINILVQNAADFERLTKLFFQLAEQPLADRHELTGAGGGAVQVEHLRHLSEAELDAIIAGGGDADSD